MKCMACNKEITNPHPIYSQDGDAVCDEKCKQLLKDQLTYLCDHIFPDEQATEDFILGKTDYPEELRTPEE